MYPTVHFQTALLRTYGLTWHAKTAPWSSLGGIYLFGKPPGSMLDHGIAFYIGQTNNFSSRLCSHEKWEQAVRLGATMVAAVHVSNPFERDRLEEEMIQRIQPILNRQLRAGMGLLYPLAA